MTNKDYYKMYTRFYTSFSYASAIFGCCLWLDALAGKIVRVMQEHVCSLMFVMVSHYKQLESLEHDLIMLTCASAVSSRARSI